MKIFGGLPALALLAVILSFRGAHSSTTPKPPPQNQCETIVTYWNETDIMPLRPSDIVNGTLTFNFQLQGDFFAGVDFYPNPTEDLYIYRVGMGDAMSSLRKLMRNDKGLMVEVALFDSSKSIDVLRANESRPFTITLAQDGTFSLTWQTPQPKVILNGKDTQPLPVKYFKFFGWPTATWKFNC